MAQVLEGGAGLMGNLVAICMLLVLLYEKGDVFE